MEKLAVQLFGNSEYSLRLFPFLSGAIALLAFSYFATGYCSKMTAAIAIAFFACLPYLVYYATEFKKYSRDVAIAAGKVFIQPNYVAEIRPIIQYIQTHKQAQDMIYVYSSPGTNPFRYYATKYQFLIISHLIEGVLGRIKIAR